MVGARRGWESEGVGVGDESAPPRSRWMDRRSLRHSYSVNGFHASTYGDSFADVYDQWYPDVSDAAATAEFVDRFGPGQRVLELGTGTGRLARALNSAGHAVVGVDSSMEMLRRFTASAEIACADMSVMPFGAGSFDTVLIATNTFFNLATAKAQQECMRETRRVLRLGGRAIIEAYVPADPDPAVDRLVTTRSIEIDEVVLTASIRDEVSQTVTGQHIQISEQGIRLRPWKIRYAGPTELDEMASAGGLMLGDRHSDWSAGPFGDGNTNHVSVYVAT